MPTYLAFDLGASSSRAILGILDDGGMRMEEIARFATPLVERNGRLYWELDALGAELDAALDRALREEPGLRSLSVDSWGVDYVPLDEAGRPVRAPYAYRDPRTAGLAAEAFARVPAEEIYRTTGIQFMEINTLYQLLADLRDEPALAARTRLHLPIADYFNHRFGGRAACEVSLASTTQLMDVRTRDWSAALMRAFDLDPAAWPQVVPSGTPLGPARRAPGVQVVAGLSHDTACAVAAVPGEETGSWAYVSCGTWSLLGAELAEPVLSDAAREANFTNEAGVDGTIRFLKNLTGLWVLQELEREWREAGDRFTYDALLAEAEAAPAPAYTINLDDPRFGARGGMTPRLHAYCRERGLEPPASRGALVRTILESLARRYAETLRVLEGLIGRRVERLHLVGGGSRNRLLCRATAEACGCEVVSGPVEATALGNLLIQARALGDLSGGRTIRGVVRADASLRTFRPGNR